MHLVNGCVLGMVRSSEHHGLFYGFFALCVCVCVWLSVASSNGSGAISDKLNQASGRGVAQNGRITEASHSVVHPELPQLYLIST